MGSTRNAPRLVLVFVGILAGNVTGTASIDGAELDWIDDDEYIVTRPRHLRASSDIGASVLIRRTCRRGPVGNSAAGSSSHCSDTAAAERVGWSRYGDVHASGTGR